MIPYAMYVLAHNGAHRYRSDPKTVSRRDTSLAKRLEGDIVVTRVARHYALGRLNADLKTQTPVETQDARSDALRRACVLAGADCRVLLYERACSGHYIQIDCSESFDPNRIHGERRIKSRPL